MIILIHTAASPYGKSPVGGAETSLRLMAEKLVLRGHTVYFITKGSQRSLKVVNNKKIHGVHVVSFHKFLNPFKLYFIDKWSNSYSNFYLEKLLKRKHVEVVHTYYNLSLCEPYLERLRSGSYQFKLVVRIAGMKWLEEIKRAPQLKKRYELLFSEADSLNFISEGLLKLFKEGLDTVKIPFNPKNYFVKDIGVSLKNIRTAHLNNEKETFECVMVSRLTHYQKRQDILIDAIALLPKATPIRLKLIGDGPNYESLHQQIQELGVEDKVEIHSFMPQDELWNEIVQSHLICHSCDYEGLSKIIIESMAMGKAVLASNVLPLNNYIVDNDNGFLVENSPKAWAERIENLMQDKQKLTAVGQRANTFVNNQFNADKNVETYVEEFQKLITIGD